MTFRVTLSETAPDSCADCHKTFEIESREGCAFSNKIRFGLDRKPTFG